MQNFKREDSVSESNSPRELNEDGMRILEKSGMKRFIHKHKRKLFSLIKERGVENAHDADSNTAAVMMNLLEFFPEMEEDLKEGAFKAESDIETILFVGTMYLRNLVFEKLGFDINELDKPEK